MLDRVAGGADLLVDLEAALQRGPVVGAEDAVERPFLTRRRWRLLGGAGAVARAAHSAAISAAAAKQVLRISGLRHRRAGAARGAPRLRSTAAPMLHGNGRGRSSLPISGNRIRKWTKVIESRDLADRHHEPFGGLAPTQPSAITSITSSQNTHL